jgi:hypothetical protein
MGQMLTKAIQPSGFHSTIHDRHPSLGHRSSMRPSKSARRICHVPHYWHTPIRHTSSPSSAHIWPASDRFRQHTMPPRLHLCTATLRSAHTSSSGRTQLAERWSPPIVAPTRSCHGEKNNANPHVRQAHHRVNR